MRRIIAASLLAESPIYAQSMSSPDAEVYFIHPQAGATLGSPISVVFGLKGMGVAPAGTEKDGTSHYHLLIDRPPLGEGPDGADELIYRLPSDDNHKHFGGGQTEVTLDLATGSHTLQLVLGDASHVPFDPPIVSDVITITVE